MPCHLNRLRGLRCHPPPSVNVATSGQNNNGGQYLQCTWLPLVLCRGHHLYFTGYANAINGNTLCRHKTLLYYYSHCLSKKFNKKIFIFVYYKLIKCQRDLLELETKLTYFWDNAMPLIILGYSHCMNLL